MDWRLKALLQLAFSMIPQGEQLNYFVQRYVVRSLPVSNASIAASVSYAKRHIDALQRHSHRALGQATFYEFGAGWDMVIPLALYGFGVETQTLVDIRRLMRVELISDTVERYQRMTSELAIPRRPAALLNYKNNVTTLLKQQYGIDYRAPCDARETGLPSGSIDYITSTSTLEHIPLEDIRLILQECHRILCDEGLMSVLIDYDDHYSYSDGKISCYNFLQYSDRIWALFSPPLHYQNRLRHRDYLELFQSAGFYVIEDQHKDPIEMDLKELEQLSVDARFRNYSLRDLAVHNALLVIRKRPAGNPKTKV